MALDKHLHTGTCANYWGQDFKAQGASPRFCSFPFLYIFAVFSAPASCAEGCSPVKSCRAGVGSSSGPSSVARCCLRSLRRCQHGHRALRARSVLLTLLSPSEGRKDSPAHGSWVPPVLPGDTALRIPQKWGQQALSPPCRSCF